MGGSETGPDSQPGEAFALPLVVPAPDAGTRRVSLRRRLSPSEGGGHTDVVGHVIAETAESLVLLPESTGPVVVARAAIAALREIPEQAVRPTSSADKLERLLDRTWPGVQRARLGGWVLRASGGVTMRANSVLVAGDPGVGSDEAIQVAERWYAERGLPVAFQCVLDEAGMPVGVPEPGRWRLTSTAHVLVADVRRLDLADPRGLGARGDSGCEAWHFDDAPSDAWLALWRGGMATPEARSEVGSAPAAYLTLDEDHGGADDAGDVGVPVAVGRVANTADWCVLSCLEVVPHRRREGLGRRATIAMLEHARAVGARFASLQVAVDNTPALALYEGLGFTRHHTYAYAVQG